MVIAKVQHAPLNELCSLPAFGLPPLPFASFLVLTDEPLLLEPLPVQHYYHSCQWPVTYG